MPPLLLKLLLTPLLIAIATLVQRRWGHLAGGRFIGLPLTSAPLLLMLAIDRGSQFAATASVSSLAGQLCVALFCLGYARAVARHRWPVALAAGLACFAIAALIQDMVGFSLLLQESIVPLGLVAVLAGWPDAPTDSVDRPTPTWELPARMLVAVVFTLLVTESAPLLGSRLAGLVAALPVFTGLLVVFVHNEAGPASATAMVRGVVLSTFSASAFFLTVATSLSDFGVMPAFLLALSVAAAAHLAVGTVAASSGRPIALWRPR
ncbi:MAG: hypothetical protein JOZ47_22850 [Kutzneria sp.]|nr:hypothetical protein [Kutzneria sp.]